MATTAEDLSYVRIPACPGEGCVFGRWRVREQTPLYAALGDDEPMLQLMPGQHVEALDGLIHGLADIVKIRSHHGDYRKGDILYIQDYIGEGSYHVRYQGHLRSDDSLYCLFDTLGTPACREVSQWAELIRRGSSVWWVKVQLADGRTGWARGDAFAGQSAIDMDLDDPEVCWWYDPDDRPENTCRQRGLPSPQEDASVCEGMVLRGYMEAGSCKTHGTEE